MIYTESIKNIFLFCVMLAGWLGVYAQQPAFPGAEGFGENATGGRGGFVYVVTNLNDSGEGSLRKGIIKRGPRTIVFAVSGTIELKSDLDINRGNLTILGQTTPGDGITIKGYPVSVKADNVIIRYLRFRMGDVNKIEDDAFGGRDTENVIIDHCSISWSTDENASFYRNTNFTLQWSIISEALNLSVHHKGAHGYGGIWGGVKASFHHNLIASNNSRNPRFSGSSSTKNSENEFVDFRNNVIFNWGFNNIYGGEKGNYNVVNNYFKPGPATEDSKKERIVNPSKPYGKFYVDGNYMEGSESVTKNNWDRGVQCENPEATRLDEEILVKNIKTQSPVIAYNQVLNYAGASHKRDGVDLRIVNEIRTGKTTFGNGIIDSQEEVGGWPELKSVEIKDTDEDGIPDEWEKEHGLDPNRNDSNQHKLSEIYANIEVYANSLVEQQYDIVVAKDGTGDFSTVQEAINRVPDLRKNRTTIFIKKGIYKEKLILPASKTNVAFIGEDKNETVLTYNDYAQKKNVFGENIGTSGSSSFFIFGDGFTAKNITFENSAGPVGQAVAVRIDGDKVVFENCRFLGNQDTLYLHGKQSRQYYKDCYIEGTVDFIFGWSTGFFENCVIHCKNKGYITAASTTKETEYGMVFKNCKITGEGKDTFYLGRPWRDYAKTVWIDCYFEDHIKAEGWHNWNKPKAEKTAFYAEYNSSGPGTSRKRVKWAKQLTAEQAQEFTRDKVLQGDDDWILKL
ncbi:pectinesterase family protein [Galbibacter sp. EGI 63066]|uniref:pectinesterase family protein n=1 Tax=Galbibacter sp. EGI 63066 TaxID=2993559 RepID=UPI00224948DB|nr:pectinesterase family protein [Galbibacter sp. EGI 63066]MCX2680003.1 pectinesterase family protein [Galbibacter sp. EGI 63066]